MFVSPYEILEFFAVAGGEDASGSSEPETSTIRDVDGLRICAGIDGLPDGKHIDRLSELASDKPSICLSDIVSLVRYYFVLNLLMLHAKPTKVDKSYKRPPKIFNFRSASGRALSVSGELDPERPQSPDLADTGCPIDCYGDCEHCVRH